MNTNSSVTAARTLNRPAISILEDKYPIKRGLVGNLGYMAGMAVSRLCVRMHAEGLENIPSEAPYVIAANHETYVDGMWIGSCLSRKHFKALSCIAAKDLEDSHGPFGRLIVKVGRAIAVDRFGNASRGLIIAKRKVDEGNIMLVHPEGTRSIDGRLAEFKDGASYIAIKSKVPLLPVFIDGGYEVFNRHMNLPHPWDHENHRRREVILTFGKPLLPANFSSAREMTAALTEWMQARFREKKIPRFYPAIGSSLS